MEWRQDLFATRLEGLLAERGVTQKKFAESLGIPETTLSNWKGTNEPTITSVTLVAAKLNVKPSYLLYGEQYEKDDEEADLVKTWQKFDSEERSAFTAMLNTMARGREKLKTEKVRKPRAKPTGDGAESASAPSLPAALRKVQEYLAEIQTRTVPSIDPEFALAQSANELLDRLFDPRHPAKDRDARAKPQDAAATNVSNDATDVSRKLDSKP